jgi:hypothetical protein
MQANVGTVTGASSVLFNSALATTCTSALSFPSNLLKICFGGEIPVGRPRNRWEDVIQRNAANLLRIRNWKAVERDKKLRKKVGEASWPRNRPKRHRRRIY